MSTTQQLIPVPFYEDIVLLVGKDNEALVAMKPIVTNMGLDWKSQHTKIVDKFNSVMVEITTTGGDGKQYDMTCLPLRKLPAWLYSISPNKVNPELRDKIIRYQEECDDALWNYWSKGSASRAGLPNVTQQIALSRHRIALLKELERTREREMRSAIHEQLSQISRQLGLSVPALDAIGKALPHPNKEAKRLWDALDFLDSKGVAYNHHKKPDTFLALNWKHLQKCLNDNNHGLKLTFELCKAARESSIPRYIGDRTVSSSIKPVSVSCHVFEARVSK